MDSEFDRLDKLAERVAKGDLECARVLSTGEYLYVALAANSATMLDSQRGKYTMVEAFARVGPDWTAELIRRWQYRGDPATW